MTVPLHERKISQLQFYRTGIELRAALTAWLMCDFGINPAKSKFGGAAVAPYMSDEDRKAITSILEKYGFQHLAFEWLVHARAQKAKAYGGLVDEHMPRKDVANAYQSWRGNAIKFDSHRSVHRMDQLYTHLFVDN